MRAQREKVEKLKRDKEIVLVMCDHKAWINTLYSETIIQCS